VCVYLRISGVACYSTLDRREARKRGRESGEGGGKREKKAREGEEGGGGGEEGGMVHYAFTMGLPDFFDVLLDPEKRE
jgi:hypothetical protein